MLSDGGVLALLVMMLEEIGNGSGFDFVYFMVIMISLREYNYRHPSSLMSHYSIKLSSP